MNYPTWYCPSCKSSSLRDGVQSCNCSVEDQERAARKQGR